MAEPIPTSITDTLYMVRCPSCSIAFSITQAFLDLRRKDHNPFYCPVGHSMTYNMTEDEKSKDKIIEQQRQTISNLQAEIITLREVRETEPKDWRVKLGLKA